MELRKNISQQINTYIVFAYKYLLLFLPSAMLSQKYETQKYDVIQTMDNFEIRYCPPTIKAKVSSKKLNFINLLYF